MIIIGLTAGTVFGFICLIINFVNEVRRCVSDLLEFLE
jgi:hypothetical protein